MSILQSPLWHWYCRALALPVDNRKPLGEFVAYAAVLVALSVGLYYLYERPVERRIRALPVG